MLETFYSWFGLTELCLYIVIRKRNTKCQQQYSVVSVSILQLGRDLGDVIKEPSGSGYYMLHT